MPSTPVLQNFATVSFPLLSGNPNYTQQHAVSPYLLAHLPIFFANFFGDEFAAVLSHHIPQKCSPCAIARVYQFHRRRFIFSFAPQLQRLAFRGGVLVLTALRRKFHGSPCASTDSMSVSTNGISRNPFTWMRQPSLATACGKTLPSLSFIETNW